MNEQNNQPGLIDATDRVTQELLSTPKVKDAIKIIIKSLDPESAPGLVRTLMWKDPDLFLALAGAAPDLINALILGSKEAVEQVDKIPPPLIAELVAKVIDKVDGEAVGCIIRNGLDMYNRTKDIPGEPVRKSISGFSEKVRHGLEQGEESPASLMLAVLQPVLKEQVKTITEEAKKEDSETSKLIKGLSETLAESLKENPDFITHVYTPLSEPFRRAAGETD